jgi:hypothetical protein
VWDFFNNHGFWVCVVGLPVLGWVVTEAVANWRKVKVSEQAAVLKQNMIERGMSADDIERVLRAGKPGDRHA